MTTLSNTLTQMAAGFGQSIGLDSTQLLQTFILVQIVGVPCAILLGGLGQRFGARPWIQVALAIYLGVTVYAFTLDNSTLDLFGWQIPEIYVLGCLIGLVQGGLQALSRSTFTALIPAANASSYFGLYNMLGKGGAIIGPLLMGTIGWFSGDPRWGALAVAVLFIAGWVLLARAPKA